MSGIEEGRLDKSCGEACLLLYFDSYACTKDRPPERNLQNSKYRDLYACLMTNGGKNNSSNG